MLEDGYTRSESTTWRLKVVKIRRPAGGHRDSAAKPLRWRRLYRRNPAEWMHMRVKYQGGGSGWVLVEARGITAAFPADAWLLNVVLDVNNAH